MRFSDIKENENLVKALVGMVDSGRIPHAILFHENDGGGGVPLALAFLQYLYCKNRADGDSCGECPECNKIRKLIHPDVRFIFPVAGKDLASKYVEEWRELVTRDPWFRESDLDAALGIEGKQGIISVAESRGIIDSLLLSAVQGGWRSVLIYLPEKMNQQAANALLKILEEPSESTIFLLITHSPESVMKTIYSRCLLVRVIPLSEEEELRVHPEKSPDYEAFCDIFHDLVVAIEERNLSALIEIGETMAALPSREKQKNFCRFTGEALRRIFLLQQGLGDLARIPEEEKLFYSESAAKLPKKFPRVAISHFDRAAKLVSANVNQKILFSDLTNRLYLI